METRCIIKCCWGDCKNIFQISLNQTEIRFYLPFFDLFGTTNRQRPFAVPNQSENGKYNLISVWFNKISKRFFCVRSNILSYKRLVQTRHCNHNKLTNFYNYFKKDTSISSSEYLFKSTNLLGLRYLFWTCRFCEILFLGLLECTNGVNRSIFRWYVF